MFKTQPQSTLDSSRDDLAVQIQHLNYFFGVGDLSKQVLFDISLELPKGQIVILTGPSGSGKTTLLTLAGALRRLQDGSLRVLGKELVGLGDRALVNVRRNIGFIFQAHNLFESLTASQNVEMAVELTGKFASKREQSVTMLSALGLADRVDYKPKSLSGGQKQRVAIARALVNHPKLILADEPTAALDKKSGRDVVTYLHNLSRQEGCTVLMVTHDNRILDVADRIINLVDGRLESDSTPNDFVQHKTQEALTEVSADMFIM
ncbi:ATP-binding cassette domain-containing protein [Leptothoe spongobia]|uniref:ATP-binding cassette domain-containing protein n=1 Tax=Leptothoe spongobia TAU-MAC 1115 TaxID=1967444 RepID=A0A947DF89_9CYAN|nr:ATP-binding cassette domain-containing protein [Leptothoe spongobia]MBT9315574.1 ATP-binding cassette domain-containing protein [Leptothoe spongobia TAU-MAC 1115]